jgi:signal transduction histidine kinase
MNILMNAIDALDTIDPTQALGTITITTDVAPDNYVVIQIADNGAGMTETVKQRVFDPFFTTKPIGQGTGLGLSISYQIITQRHHGTLSCESTPGVGTTFEMRLKAGMQR